MLEGVFGIRAAGSSVNVEVVGGATTFMTMAYILFANGQEVHPARGWRWLKCSR